MNPYCRRAVAKGVELSRQTGGSCTAITLGPPIAEDVLREAVAWGADSALHLCDPKFAGSDTLVTARALAAALSSAGPFDLILLGRNTIDGETGQVGPEVAQLLDLPFAAGARSLQAFDTHLALELETDDGFEVVEIDLPAVLSVAERLCEPCKVDQEGRAKVAPERIHRLTSATLGEGPWGEAGSPTRVGAVRTMEHQRDRHVLKGPLKEQVADALQLLARREALQPKVTAEHQSFSSPEGEPPGITSDVAGNPQPIIAVIVEHDRLQVARELIGAAAAIADHVGGQVRALCPRGYSGDELAAAGAHVVVELAGSRVAEDVAGALVSWMTERSPWAVLAPSTSFGREVAGRAAAATGSGLVGDAIGLHVVDGSLVAAKPAFAGALEADITWRSEVQLVTIRPGIMPVPPNRSQSFQTERRDVSCRGRVRVLSERRTDEIEALARAEVVIGVGVGVQPDEYELLSRLSAILDAELAATRKVTDKGWAPRSRQIGLTGRSIAPRLYIAIGLSGKFNHMVGVRSAGSILAINSDLNALVFDHCDVGIVGDWREVLPILESGLRASLSTLPLALRPGSFPTGPPGGGPPLP
jgi:electron transfer flavoprotein alpha subunit